MAQQSSWVPLIRLHAYMQPIVRAVSVCNEPRRHGSFEKPNGILGRDDWASIAALVIHKIAGLTCSYIHRDLASFIMGSFVCGLE